MWYSSSELAGLPGMPSLRTNVTRKALAEGWQFRQRNGKGGGREYTYDSLPAQTQAALHKIDCALERSLDLNLEQSDGTTCWISNESPVPIQVALTPAKAVEERKDRPLITCRQLHKAKVEGGFIEQRTDAWLEILKAYETWCKLQKYSSALICDL